MSEKRKNPPNIEDYIHRKSFNISTRESCGEMLSKIINIYPDVTEAIVQSDYDNAISGLELMVEYIQMFQAPIREKAQEVRNRKWRGKGQLIKFRKKTH